MKAIIYIFLILISYSGIAQDAYIDSLTSALESAKTNSEKVNLLIELSKSSSAEPSVALKYAVDAKNLAEKLNLRQKLALAYKYIGLAYINQNMYTEATLNWQEALQLFTEIGDKSGISNILNNLGNIYSNQGDDEKALELYLESLKIAEEINDKMRILTVSLNIGLIYQKKEATLDKALEYYLIAYNMSEELNYLDGIGYSSVNMGEVYFVQGNDSIALHYFQQSLNALQNSNALPYPMINIGKVYTHRGEYQKAVKILKEAYEISNGINSKLYMAQSLMALAGTQIKEHQFDNALNTLKEAEKLADEIGSKESLKEIYQDLAKYSAQNENYRDAYVFQEKLTAINDSLFRSANEKRLNLMLMSFNLEKKEKEIEVQELNIQKQRIAKNAILAGLIFILIIAFIIFRNYLAKVKINKVLDTQKAQIESLLLNILPKKIANELQLTGTATPREYESVTVLFTDFKDFTKISAQLTPDELVKELNEYFIAFDDITGKYNLEKIKTIGDAYMCAGGLPTTNNTHPFDTINAAFEMLDFMKKKKKSTKEINLIPWELRIGIHTGPIMAGVVGRKKYAYDIWGSTVNVASRMESNSEPGKINISEATYMLVKDHYASYHRGKIMAKNVGEIDMYFVEKKNQNITV